MKQILDAIDYIHSRGIYINPLEYIDNLDYDKISNINLDNILINFDSEIDRENINLMNAKIKLINFKEAYDTSIYFDMKDEIYFDLTIRRQQAIIFGIGKICYELLTGKTLFKNIDKSVDYYIPNYLSIEAINFLNITLQI